MNSLFTKGHFLHVDVIVPGTKVAAFEKAVKAFLKRGRPVSGNQFMPFQVYGDQFRIRLALALKSVQPFTLNGHPTATQSYKRSVPSGTKVYHYVHLWEVPTLHAGDLTTLMMRSSDDQVYLAIDAQVARESQDFVYRVDWQSSAANARVRRPRSKSSPQFVRITRQLQSADVGPYLFTLGTLYPALRARGCDALGTFQNVTGPLNTVIELWQTTGRANGLKAIDSAVKALPGVLRPKVPRPSKTFPESEVREAFTLAPYSPLADLTPCLKR